MCVILHALKKKHMRRPEIVEAMRNNDAGFAMFALKPGGRRESIRTLDQKELLDFFDTKVGDDDEVAMHARIPSRGAKNLANVHGWEEDGVVFMHNMTISSLDGLMCEDKWDGTDSEYFFRSLFMPLFRRWGGDAYKDGRLDPYLDRMVRFFAGTVNKFLFIMPDNRVLRYGTWVDEPSRTENGETAFFASNSTYKPYERTWPAAPTAPAHAGAGSGELQDRRRELSNYYQDYYSRYWGAGRPVEYDGRVLRKLAGDGAVAEAGLKLHALANVLRHRGLAAAEAAGKSVAKCVQSVYTRMFAGVYDGDEDLLAASDPVAGSIPDASIADWLDLWSAELERFLETDCNRFKTKYYRKSETQLREAFDAFSAKLDAALAAGDVFVDLRAERFDDVFAAFVPAVSRKGRPTMRRLCPAEIVSSVESTDEDAVSTVRAIIVAYIKTAAQADHTGTTSGAGGAERRELA